MSTNIPNNSIVAGGCFPSPSLPSKPLPAPLPELPRPQPLPLPAPRPGGIVDRFLTPVRSEQIATTQSKQLDSIQQGVKNGSITEQEASKLLDQQACIAEATGRATADGVVTAQEAASIRLLQAKAGLDGFVARHNNQCAKPSDPSITNQQAAQIRSIAQGVRSGSLTGSEAGTLLRDQASIAREVSSAQADGSIDFIEKLVVGIRQDAASYEIGLEKGDTQKAPHAKRLNFPVLF